ncbi:MAG: 1-deoxy-D-xylulose-5-phosphate synthase [Phycisphaerales bacterium JB047]
MKSRIMYIEHKNDSDDRGPARIGRVRYSKSGSSVYYRGARFETLKGAGVSGNYVNVETGDEYWISGCKKNGQDRHWAGSGIVEIDEDVREEYWTDIRGKPELKDKRVV